MYSRYRSRLYLAVAINAFIAVVFVGSEAFILSFGSWLKNLAVSRQFHRIEQLAATFFIFALPFLVASVFELNIKIKKATYYVSYFLLFVALVITVFAFVYPDLFISLTNPADMSFNSESDYGRGKEGILYELRDVILGLLMLHSVFCALYDLVILKKIRDVLYPVIGIAVAIYGGVLDILFVYSEKNYDFFPDFYFSRFCVGITFMILMYITEITRRFIDAAREVEAAHKIISISEKKYRLLVEETNDCIFSLDMNLDFMRMNRSTERQMHIDRAASSGLNFFDIIYGDPEDIKFTRQLVKNKIDELISKGRTGSFKLNLKSFGTREPKEFHVRCELVNIDDHKEILVKASSHNEDGPMKYLDHESGIFAIEKYLIAAEEISSRLVLNLPKFLNPAEVNSVKIGLREIIINAIDNGNTNITFDDKKSDVSGESYSEFILSRNKNSNSSGSRVTIEYFLNPERVVYKIKDDRGTLDYRRIIDSADSSVEVGTVSERDSRMAKNIFDEISFSDESQLVIVKNFYNRELTDTL